MSMILHYLFSLSVTAIFGLQCSISVSLWIAKPQSILNLSFSNTDSGRFENHENHVCENHNKSQISCTGASVFFSKSPVSPLVLISSQDRKRTDNVSETFNFLFVEPAQRRHILVVNVIFHYIYSKCLFLGNTHEAFSFPFQLTCFQPLSSRLILHPFCFSEELTMQSFLFPCCLSLILLFFLILPTNLCSSL